MTAPTLDDVIEAFRKSLWLPDAGVVLVAIATVVANRAWSPPVWMLLVGPPSSGKSETLDALARLPELVPVSTFSEAGLLSGSSSRQAGLTTGGLLRQIGDRGLLAASDFGT